MCITQDLSPPHPHQVVLHEDRQDVEVHYVDTATRLPEWTNGGQTTIGICGETPETCQMYRHFTVQVIHLPSVYCIWLGKSASVIVNDE